MLDKSGQEGANRYEKNDRILLDPISLWEKHFCTGALKQLLSFGLHIGDTDFAIEACSLNRDALAPSSRSTYSTRVNHLRNFTKKYVKIPFPLENYEPPSYLSFSLVFFAAYLFETDSIRSYNTIRNYMLHVQQVYIFEKGLSRETVWVSHSKNFEKRNLKEYAAKTGHTDSIPLYPLPPTTWISDPQDEKDSRGHCFWIFHYVEISQVR